MGDKELIELIANNAKTADWRKVQEWFWSLEREKNPTLDILVDGGEIGSTGFIKVVRRPKANRKCKRQQCI